MVLSKNVKTGETGFKKVLYTSIRVVPLIIVITLVSGARLEVTPGHYFWLADGIGGWVPAKKLTCKHVLLERHEGSSGAVETCICTDDDRLIHVDIVRSITTKRGSFTVHNMIVEDWHAYYVSDHMVLAHNGSNHPGSEIRGFKAPKKPTRAPDFIVSKGGTAFPVPKGASGPIPAQSGKGFRFTGGSGGHGLSPRTTDVRIMDPVTSGKYIYPGGYGSYGNVAGQTVNPFTGRTIPKSDPWWHIPAK